MRSTTRLRVASAVLVAAGSDESDPEVLTRRGAERYAAGDYLGATAIWEKLLETLGGSEGVRLLYNLGLTYEKLGDATRAGAGKIAGIS